MYPWYRDSVAAAAAAGLGGPVGVVGSGFCSTGPGQGATTIKTESGYSDCMLALDYVQSKVCKCNFGLDCLGPMFVKACNRLNASVCPPYSVQIEIVRTMLTRDDLIRYERHVHVKNTEASFWKSSAFNIGYVQYKETNNFATVVKFFNIIDLYI
ncbi:hypothetical protein ALC56_10174 [Trachymyrmex septentrionalis]|uniref:Uncharacterized protein n=1 Tax=Trachymyrmex septentrionalis TaxID=34720 RepID=A0A195F6C5_9HYME|nr:hypothetical protein ALC56_10174 [Trachymyrmex septentrionalis]